MAWWTCSVNVCLPARLKASWEQDPHVVLPSIIPPALEQCQVLNRQSTNFYWMEWWQIPRLPWGHIFKTQAKHILQSISCYRNASCFNHCWLGAFRSHTWGDWFYDHALLYLKIRKYEGGKGQLNNAGAQTGLWEDSWIVFPSLWTSLEGHITPSTTVGKHSSSELFPGLEAQNLNHK